jgi:hypothetical protein
MTAAARRSAHERHQQALSTAYPQSIILGGKSYDVAAIERTTMIEDAKGGFRMGRTLLITAPSTSLAESVLFDATTGVLKRLNLTLRGRTFRLKRASLDSHRVLWTLEATEAVS